MSTTVLVVTADLQGDPAGIIKAFNDAQKASERFRQQQEEESRKTRSAWQKISDMSADISKGFKGVGDTLESVGGKLTKGITLPAVGAATALGGIALAGGWGRLTSIENATKQIESLGFTAEQAGQIIGVDVLNSVQGTAFALQDAGTWAAGALAAGIQPGQELTKYLTLAGDAATRANTDFGSMANMLLQVEGAGKLTGGMMTQMTENGLFVLPMLQKEFGKTATEIQDMVSKGEVSAAQFREILEKNVAGAALASGDTAQGALANLRTAFSNLGATALTEVYPQMKAVFGEITALLKSPELKAAAADIGRMIAEAFSRIVETVRNVVTWFSSLDPAGKQAVMTFVAIAVAVGPVIMAVGKIVSIIGTLIGIIGPAVKAIQAVVVAVRLVNAAMMANPIGLIIGLIGLLIGALIWFFTETELGQQIWAEFTRFLGEAWTNIVAVATTVFGALASFFTDVWTNISSFVTTVVGAIASFFVDAWTNISSFFTDVWTTASAIFMGIWNGIVGFLTPIFEFIATLIRVYIEIWVNVFLIFAAVLKTIWDGIVMVATAIWQAILDFITPIVTAIVSFVTTYINSLLAFWTWVWNAVSSFFIDVWNGIVSFIAPIVQGIVDLIIAAVTWVQSTWNAMWAAISAFFIGVWQGIVAFITPIVQQIQANITGAVMTVQSIWNSTWSAISSFLSGVWNNIVSAVSAAVGNVISTVSGLWGQIMSFFGGAGQWLYDVGTDIIQGLINGITSMIGGVISAISDTVNGAIDWAKSTLGIASPSKVFIEIGEYTGEGMEVGLAKAARGIRAASVNLIPEIPDPKKLTASWDLAANTGTYGTPSWMGGAASGVGARTEVTLKVDVSALHDLDLDMLVDLLLERMQYALGSEVTTA